MTIEEGTQNLHSVHLRAISQFHLIPSNALQEKDFVINMTSALAVLDADKKSKTRE